MDIIDFLKTPIAALPKDRPNSIDFPDFFDSICQGFVSGIHAINGTDQFSDAVRQNVAVIQELSTGITSVIKDYYAGRPQDAFKRLNDLLATHVKYFEGLYSIPIDPTYLAHLYRLRVQDTGSFTREQMFHIPFQFRHKVKTQRYSIPGFPSLYLGSSSYIGWKELGCPQFDNLYSVRLQARTRIQVLDFGYLSGVLAEFIAVQIKSGTNNQHLLDVLLPKVLFWPLIAACSIRTLHRDDPFKPEYIVPQMVLQYVKEVRTHKIDGIRYFSTHYDQQSHSLSLGCNFVFPVKTSPTNGICSELRQLFDMTEVLPWQIGTHVQLPSRPTGLNQEIELVKGCPCLYLNTIFGEIESKQNFMIATPI
jgi:hypothetical protein